jgi:hypothetical protein
MSSLPSEPCPGDAAGSSAPSLAPDRHLLWRRLWDRLLSADPPDAKDEDDAAPGAPVRKRSGP